MGKIIDFVNACQEAKDSTRTRVLTLSDMGSSVTIRADRMEMPKWAVKLKEFPQVLFDREHQQQLLGIFTLDVATFYQDKDGMFCFYQGGWRFKILPQNQGLSELDAMGESLAHDLTQGSDDVRFFLTFDTIRFKLERCRGKAYDYDRVKDVMKAGALDGQDEVLAYAKTVTYKPMTIGGLIWLADVLGKRFKLTPSMGPGGGLYLYSEEMLVRVTPVPPKPKTPSAE